MLFHRMHLPLLAVTAALALGAAGCIFSPEEEPVPPPPRPEIPPLTSPDNVIAALEVIYNDTVRSAQERRDEYQKLLLERSPAFLFRFQPSDVGTDPGGTGVPIPPSWGRDEEINAHERLFTAQENGQVFSLTLDIQRLSDCPDPLEDPPPPGFGCPIEESGKEGWYRIFATNVQLRLMFNPNDGLEVDGGQAEFDFAPVDPEDPTLWTIGEWKDLPRP